MSIYRQLLKHSGVYAVGEGFARVASILLLPLYLHYLNPADIAVIALTDVITAVLGILVARGITTAVSRYHFDEKYESSQHALWVSGLVALTAIALGLLIVTWLLRDLIADGLLVDPDAGVDVETAASYVSLSLAVLAASLVGGYMTTYVRVLKRSTLYVVQQLITLLLKIGFNIKFIAFDELGVLGFFYSGIIGGAFQGVVLLGVLFVGKPVRVIPEVFPKIFRFGWPFVVSGLATLSMHQADRYLLKQFLGLEQTGIYSLAHNIVMAVNTLLLLPFFQIWSVTIYEIDATADRLQVFRRVFKYFVLTLFLVLLAVALFSESILRIVSKPEFLPAASIIPIHCLAFNFYSLHALFSVPSMIHKRTGVVALTAIVAAVVNVLANLVLIPQFGVYGAAVGSVMTYITYSFFGQWRYAKIERIGYPIGYVFCFIVFGAVLVLGWRYATSALIGGVVTESLSEGLKSLFHVCVGDRFEPEVLRDSALATANILISAGIAAFCWLVALAIVLRGPARELFEEGAAIRDWWERWRKHRRAQPSENAESRSASTR